MKSLASLIGLPLFTKCDITTNYCVALSFSDAVIEVFNTRFPITIINDWHVSIRPCEINNFSNLLNINLSISRGNNEYKALMNYLEKNQISLVDILDYEDFDYNMVKRMITSTTKNHHSYIFDVLDKCRSLCISCCDGRNLLRFLLHRMNNRVIKDQLPYSHEKSYAGLNISAKCMPFDRHPYAFNPKNIYQIFLIYWIAFLFLVINKISLQDTSRKILIKTPYFLLPLKNFICLAHLMKLNS